VVLGIFSKATVGPIPGAAAGRRLHRRIAAKLPCRRLRRTHVCGDARSASGSAQLPQIAISYANHIHLHAKTIPISGILRFVFATHPQSSSATSRVLAVASPCGTPPGLKGFSDVAKPHSNGLGSSQHREMVGFQCMIAAARRS
jgi:hypothetical protein